MIWPCLNYRDAPGAIRFLVDVVGFHETAVHTSDDGRHVQHAELTWPEGGGVMLGSAKEDGTPFEQLPTGASGLYVVTARPDEVHQRVLAAGAEVVSPLQDKEHGGRDFTIRDPEGNLWSFGTYRGTQPQ
jgi:uncharacterized glyoxalase superfamily protein PhnB